MQTRAKSVLSKPHVHPTLLLTPLELKTAKQALASPTWHAAMKEEYDALLKNNTWTLLNLLIMVPLAASRILEKNIIPMALFINITQTCGSKISSTWF